MSDYGPKIDPQDLDNYITGHYSNDQFVNEEEIPNQDKWWGYLLQSKDVIFKLLKQFHPKYSEYSVKEDTDLFKLRTKLKQHCRGVDIQYLFIKAIERKNHIRVFLTLLDIWFGIPKTVISQQLMGYYALKRLIYTYFIFFEVEEQLLETDK